MNKESKLNLNAGDYAIRHCIIDQTYNGLEVHKMLCDAYIAGSNDTLEDDDERIKNSLINLIKMSSEVGGLALHKWEADEMLAWLEKHSSSQTKGNNPLKQSEQEASYTTILETGDGGINALVTRELPTDSCDAEKKPAWSEEDERMFNSCCAAVAAADYYTLDDKQDIENWLQSLQNRVQPQPKQGEQNLVLRDTFGYEDGRLIGMNEGIGLVLDNPEKYGLQKPVKWSKEDENVISLILSICNDFLESFEISPASTKVVKEDVDKIKNWLKSLRPQPQWKPSDKQMEAMDTLIVNLDRNPLLLDNFAQANLRTLHDDLKKLKENKL